MPSNKERAKRLKCYLDLAEKHSDHLPHAFNGIGEPGIGILEGYRNGTVEAHIHVGIRSGLLAVSPSYFCARLKARDHFAPPEDATRHNATDREIVKGENIATEGTKVVGRGRLKLSVLVPNYKGFKQSKGVAASSRAPLVRLVLLDACPVSQLDGGHPYPNLLSENLLIGTDRKLRLGSAFPMRFVPRADKIMSEVVEGGAEVSENVASDKAPLDGQRLYALDVERKEAALAIELFPERVRWFDVEVGPSPHASLESVEVFLPRSSLCQQAS